MLEDSSCPRCRGGTLTGLSNGGKALALDLTLDSRPLDTPALELNAIHQGRHTWTVHRGREAWHRGPRQIKKWLAVRDHAAAVHADHRCDRGSA